MYILLFTGLLLLNRLTMEYKVTQLLAALQSSAHQNFLIRVKLVIQATLRKFGKKSF